MKHSFLVLLLLVLSCNTSDTEKLVKKNNKNIEAVSSNEPLVELYNIDKEIIKNPKSPNVYLKRALYYQNKRDFSSALEDINRALSITPDFLF